MQIYERSVDELLKFDTTITRLSISPELNINTLKQFNFDNPNVYRIPGNYHFSDSWLSFLRRVDTSKLSPGKLDVAAMHLSDKKIKLTKNTHNYELQLSPQLTSNSNDKAVIAYDYYKNGHVLAGGVILLEYQNGDWRVIKIIRTFIT